MKLKNNFILFLILVFVVSTCPCNITAFASTENNSKTIDFEELSTSATQQEIADATGLRFGTDWMGTGSYGIVEENGTKKLQINSPYEAATWGTGIDVFYDFDAPVTTGTIETKLKMGTNGLHTGAHNLMGLANGTTIRSLIEAAGKWSYYPEEAGVAVRTETDVVINPDSESGMYELRTVVSRNSAEEDWTADVYNDSGDSPELLYSTTISSDVLTQVTSIKLLGTWSMAPMQKVTLDDITVTYTELSDGTEEPPVEDGEAINFEGLSTSATQQEISSATGLRFGMDYAGAGTVGIIEENGTKKLQVNSPANTGIDVFYDFDAPITEGTIETKLKMGTNGINTGSHNLMGLGNGGTVRALLEAVYAWIYYPEVDGQVARTETDVVLEPDSESGMYELRTVVSRNSIEDDWTADVYNDSGDSPELLYSTKISSASLTQVTSIKLLGTWSLAPMEKVTLDDITVTYKEPSDEPEIPDGPEIPPVEDGKSLDFEGLSTSATPQEIADATGLRFGTDWMGTGSYGIIEENGTKKLQINSPYDVYGTGIDVLYDFDAPITVGTIETKLRMGTNGIHTGSHNLMGLSNGETVRALLEAVGKWIYYPEVDGQVVRTETDAVLEPDSESGMYELRTVVSRNSIEDDWTANVYNDSGDSPELLYSTKISSASLSQVTSIKLLGTWSLASMQKVTLDDITVTYKEPSDEPEIPDEPVEPPVVEDGKSLDFEGLSTSATQQEIARATGLRFGMDNAGAGSYNIIEENGTKKLQINSPYEAATWGTGIDVFYDFDAPVTTGTIETSVKMGTNGLSTGSHNLMGLANGGNIRSLLEAVGKWFYYPEVDGVAARTEKDVAIEPGSESGMYELRTVVSRNSTEDDWTADVYNDSGNTATLLYSTKISSEVLPQITSIKLLGTWSVAPMQTVTLDDVAVTYKELAFVEDSNCNGAEPNVSEFRLRLSQDIDEDNPEVIILKENGDYTVNTKAEYDSESREITVTPKSYLEYGTTYVVRFGDAKILSYTFTTADIPLCARSVSVTYEAQNGVVTDTQPDGIFKAHCNVNLERNGNTAEVLLIMVAYDKNDVITKISTQAILSDATDGIVTIDGLTKDKSKKILCYVWEKTLSGYHPVYR